MAIISSSVPFGQSAEIFQPCWGFFFFLTHKEKLKYDLCKYLDPDRSGSVLQQQINDCC